MFHTPDNTSIQPEVNTNFAAILYTNMAAKKQVLK
jgi:hypothetical protein